MSRKVADAIVETLEAAGVRHCYGIVGDTLNAIAERIEASEIEWIHVRHEEAGAFAAAAEASLTGRLTAVAGSCGPGSLHFINGLFEANRNRAPVILIASQITRSELGFDFPQEVNLTDVYRSCSVYCDMIHTAEQARRKTVIACQAAIARRGVAVLVVPVDVSTSDITDDVPFTVHIGKPVIHPNGFELEAMAQRLNAGGNIAIYGGSGCAGALPEIIAVAERLKAPVAHTSRAKDFIEPGNPYNVGMTGMLGNPAGYHAILECDTLLLLGADFAWRQFYPEKATIIQVDADPTHLGRRHPVDLGVVGNVKDTLAALLPLLNRNEDSSFLEHYQARHREAVEAMRAKAVPGRDGLVPGPYLTSVINRKASQDALFAADDGTAVVWALRYLDVVGTRRTFGSLLHGTMASGLPGALGLQKCQPGRQVIALCGDGGLAMLFGDLMTTVQEKLPVKIVVYDNSKLGFVELEQKSEGMLETYTHLENPDFGKVAQAMGLWGRTIDRSSEVEDAVTELLAQSGPALLHVKVRPMELVTPPHVELHAAYGMALYSARALLHGKGGDVWEMVKENFL
jgi:pyruvate dehydrogenase (quinone)